MDPNDTITHKKIRCHQDTCHCPSLSPKLRVHFRSRREEQSFIAAARRKADFTTQHHFPASPTRHKQPDSFNQLLLMSINHTTIQRATRSQQGSVPRNTRTIALQACPPRLSYRFVVRSITSRSAAWTAVDDHTGLSS